jgi:hypothetical protein
MDEDNTPDALLSEPPQFPPSPQRERAGSTSVGAAPTPNGDVVSPVIGDFATSPIAPPPVQVDIYARVVSDVINSEVSASTKISPPSPPIRVALGADKSGPQIGVQTLLNRLKQSIASAKVRVGAYHPSDGGADDRLK